jgi:multimeric flavodoxin WrbA
MRILFINGSPRRMGTVATIMKKLYSRLSENHDVQWIDVYSLNIKPCVGCMKCRETGVCLLPRDDAHMAAERMNGSDVIVAGTPVYWGNMSSMLKMLFERNVPLFMGESPRGIPAARLKGKKAVIVTACTTPWPFNYIMNQSRGSVRALKEIFKYGGMGVIAVIAESGTKERKIMSVGTERRIIRAAVKLNRLKVQRKGVFMRRKL